MESPAVSRLSTGFNAPSRKGAVKADSCGQLA
jgi:hypothetical protein